MNINDYIVISFSEAVNVTNDKTFKVVCGGTEQLFSISPTPPGDATTFDLIPSPYWPYPATCTCTVQHKGVTSASDGTEMANNYVFSFTIIIE